MSKFCEAASTIFKNGEFSPTWAISKYQGLLENKFDSKSSLFEKKTFLNRFFTTKKQVKEHLCPLRE